MWVERKDNMERIPLDEILTSRMGEDSDISKAISVNWITRAISRISPAPATHFSGAVENAARSLVKAGATQKERADAAAQLQDRALSIGVSPKDRSLTAALKILGDHPKKTAVTTDDLPSRTARIRPERRASLTATGAGQAEKIADMAKKDGVMWKCYERLPDKYGGYCYQFKMKKKV
jgi:hypothetical protein